MHQARLKSVICDLLRGDPSAALDSIVPLLKETLSHYRDVTPDPVEWAYFIVCLLCQGRLREARRRARQFRTVQHPELALIRSLVDSTVKTCAGDRALCRTSLHDSISQDVWIRQLRQMLIACGQSRVTGRLGLGPGAAGARAASQLRAPDLRRIVGTFGGPALSGLDHPFPLQAIRARRGRVMARLTRALRRIDMLAAWQNSLKFHPEDAALLERLHAIGPKSILLLYPPDYAQAMALLDNILDVASNTKAMCVFEGDQAHPSGGDDVRGRGHMILRYDTRPRLSGSSGEPWLRKILSLSGVVDFDAVLVYAIPGNVDLADLEYIRSRLNYAQLVAFGGPVDLNSWQVMSRPLDGSARDLVPHHLRDRSVVEVTGAWRTLHSSSLGTNVALADSSALPPNRQLSSHVGE